MLRNLVQKFLIQFDRTSYCFFVFLGPLQVPTESLCVGKQKYRELDEDWADELESSMEENFYGFSQIALVSVRNKTREEFTREFYQWESDFLV